jgi:probable HAF family extracellular repeat protein
MQQWSDAEPTPRNTRNPRALAVAALSVVLTSALSFVPSALAQCAPSSPCTSGPTFVISGPFQSDIEAISGDGAVAVGSIGGSTATRWVNGLGTSLGSFGGFYSNATGVSADGSVVVGYSNRSGAVLINGVRYSGDGAFRWTAATGLVDIGTLGGPSARAHGVNTDGSVVVGFSLISPTSPLVQHAFRWTQAGMFDLGTLGGTNSSANATNADGSVVVGISNLAGDTVNRAFRWTSTSGMTNLGSLGGTRSEANGVSGDGNVIIGSSRLTGDSASHAFRWTNATGMTSLGTLGGSSSFANGISANGGVIVGYSRLTGDPTTPSTIPSVPAQPTNHAFRWTAATGMRDLNTLLSTAGVNLNGIVLTRANGVSGDGKFIFGTTSGGPFSSGYIVKYDDGAAAVPVAGTTTPAPIAGITSSASQKQSVDQLAVARLGVLAQQGGFAAPLLGGDKPIASGNQAGAFASAGSAAGGGFMRLSTGTGLSLLGGISYAQEDYASAELNHAWIGAAALQYVYDNPNGMASVRRGWRLGSTERCHVLFPPIRKRRRGCHRDWLHQGRPELSLRANWLDPPTLAS